MSTHNNNNIVTIAPVTMLITKIMLVTTPTFRKGLRKVLYRIGTARSAWGLYPPCSGPYPRRVSLSKPCLDGIWVAVVGGLLAVVEHGIWVVCEITVLFNGSEM